eukprot:GHVP01027480.1.p1 GENE.GHVP01027480.1~~GHVP01027480.1.p1  ORF type:complete len:176 (+),score=10.50 GHVP01027480.1:277-804(+)
MQNLAEKFLRWRLLWKFYTRDSKSCQYHRFLSLIWIIHSFVSLYFYNKIWSDNPTNSFYDFDSRTESCKHSDDIGNIDASSISEIHDTSTFLYYCALTNFLLGISFFVKALNMQFPFAPHSSRIRFDVFATMIQIIKRPVTVLCKSLILGQWLTIGYCLFHTAQKGVCVLFYKLY